MKMFGMMIVCGLVLLAWSDAYALTIKSGEVLSDGKVMDACETRSAQVNLNDEGLHVSAKCLCIKIEEDVFKIDFVKLMGKSKSRMIEVIKAEIADEMMSRAAAALVPNIIDEASESVEKAVNEAIEVIELTPDQVEAAANAAVEAEGKLDGYFSDLEIEVANRLKNHDLGQFEVVSEIIEAGAGDYGVLVQIEGASKPGFVSLKP